MKPLKILQCLVHYLPNRTGGIEIYVQSLAKELKKNGHDVKVVVPFYAGDGVYPAEHESIPIISYPEFSNATKKEFKGLVPGKGLPHFEKIINSESPDIVHFHQVSNSNGMSIFHFEAVKKMAIPVCFTIHLFGWEKKHRIQKVVSFTDRVFVLSEWYRKYLVETHHINANIRLIKPAIPFQNLIPKKSENNKVFRLLYLGRISEEKGLHILLKALTKVKNVNWELSIYGPAIDEKYYARCMRLSKDNAHIHWNGEVKNNHVFDVLSESDVLVLPSIVEEMAPLVIQEAFSAKVPVVASDIGGITEVIEESKNGFLFKPGSSRELRKILEKLFQQPSLISIEKLSFPQVKTFDQIAKEMEQEYYSLVQ